MNSNTERTEELVASSKVHVRRNVLIVTAVILFIALIMVCFLGGYKFHQSKLAKEAQSQIALGDKAFQEEDYEKAIVFYSKAIDIDKKNPKIFTKRGNAYMQVADKKSADGGEEIVDAESDYRQAADLDEEDLESRQGLVRVYDKTGKIDDLKTVYEELERITGDSSYGDKADSAGLGNTSSNFANMGFLVETPEGVFLAGAPDGSCISKVEEDGSLTPIMQTKHDKNKRSVYISDLNYRDGFLYYVLQDNDFPGQKTKQAICRVRTDGSEAKDLAVMKDEGTFRSLLLVGDKLYYVSHSYYGGAKPCLHRMSVDGKEDEEICNNVEMFTSDGEALYVLQCNGLEYESEEFAIKIIGLDGAGDSKTILESKDMEGQIRQMIAYRGALYVSTNAYNDGTGQETVRFGKVSVKDGAMQQILERTSKEKTHLGSTFCGAITEGQLFFCEAEEYEVVKLYKVALEAEEYTTKAYSVSEGTVFPYYLAECQDRIYFRDRRTDVSEYEHGCMSADGKDVRTYNEY